MFGLNWETKSSVFGLEHLVIAKSFLSFRLPQLMSMCQWPMISLIDNTDNVRGGTKLMFWNHLFPKVVKVLDFFQLAIIWPMMIIVA